MILTRILSDQKWADRRGRTGLAIGLTTAGILLLELALIRWTSSQIRAFAYFNNVVLICAFLGIGLGIGLGRKYPGAVHLVLPVLAILAVPLALSDAFGLVHMQFPDQSVVLWGGGMLKADPWLFTRNISLFAALLLLIVAVFACAGAPLGYLFMRLPALKSYSADLVGSLIGVAVFTVVAALQGGPAIWLLLACLPFVWLSRTWFCSLAAVAIVALAGLSARDAVFSPYNRITVTHGALYDELQVNRDFHQYLYDLSDRRLANPSLPPQDAALLREIRGLYDLPCQINSHRSSALIVGAGTGNDAQAAVRAGYASIISVDIDPAIIAIGRRLHPEGPYRHPQVSVVVNDARAYFAKDRQRRFDLVCFGLLDSHAMSSAMSTLRLDNYVYTQEGIRAGWERVSPQGHLALSISCTAGWWFFDRMYWTVAKATGHEPLAFYSRLHGGAVTFVVAKPGVTLDQTAMAGRQLQRPRETERQAITPTDDWPFLYLRPGVFPYGYVTILGFLLAVAWIATRRVYGLGREERAFDFVLFLMGAAFLLIETRGVTSMSLLFGSTWVVNSAVFGGVLIMALAGNLAVSRWQIKSITPWFIALFGAVVLLYAIPLVWLAPLPQVVRGIAGGLLTGLPIGLAGIIVPVLLARSSNAAAALGSNLIGAVLGGCLEYYSMLGGLKATALLALVLYLTAFVVLRRKTADSPLTATAPA